MKLKLDDDALLGIIACFRKGLVEGVDISRLLRSMELVERDGKLGIAPGSDPWREEVGEQFWS